MIFIYSMDSKTPKITQLGALAGQIQHTPSQKLRFTPRLLRQVALGACKNHTHFGPQITPSGTVQADICLNSEQIHTLFISVGGQEGVLGGGGSFWAGGPKFAHDCQENRFDAS